MAAGEKPKFTWGASFANTLECGYPLDEAISLSEPREGSEFAKAPSGEEDSWVVAWDQLLRAISRWIPTANGTTPEGTTITGWDGSTGWRAFLESAGAKNPIRFYPLRTSGTFQPCVLVVSDVTLETDGKRRVQFEIRTTDDSPFTGF